jgi:N-acetylmuramoyl-L-alanine amidase
VELSELPQLQVSRLIASLANSVILFVVQRIIFIGLVFFAAVTIARGQQPEQPSAPPPLPIPAPAPAPPPVHLGPMIVLDPAHGGTDSGARGSNGAVERDLVLVFARAIRAELERQGYRVLLTRSDDSNPSYDDRAAVSNAYREPIFITLHVSSSGKFGTVHAYFEKPADSGVEQAATSENSQLGQRAATSVPTAHPHGAGLVPWNQAQRPFVEASHRLADLLQAEFAQRFAGSGTNATAAAIRGLRSIAAPAVAVEISSVSGDDLSALTAMAQPLAASIARGLMSFRPATTPGAK